MKEEDIRDHLYELYGNFWAELLNKVGKSAFNNQQLMELLGKIISESFCAGSSITSLWYDEKPNDYDTYFSKIDDATTLGRYAKYYYKVISKTWQAVLLDNRIQIINLLHGPPGEVVKTFDFEHCKAYWEYKTNTLVIPDTTKAAIVNKQLIYNGSKYPLVALKRVAKFIGRGFTIDKDNLEKILKDVEDLYVGEGKKWPLKHQQDEFQEGPAALQAIDLDVEKEYQDRLKNLEKDPFHYFRDLIYQNDFSMLDKMKGIY